MSIIYGGCEYVIIAATTHANKGKQDARGRHRERLIKSKQEWRMSDISAGFVCGLIQCEALRNVINPQ